MDRENQADERRIIALKVLGLKGDLSVEGEEVWDNAELREVANLIEKYGDKQRVRGLVKGTEPDLSVEVEASRQQILSDYADSVFKSQTGVDPPIWGPHGKAEI